MLGHQALDMRNVREMPNTDRIPGAGRIGKSHEEKHSQEPPSAYLHQHLPGHKGALKVMAVCIARQLGAMIQGRSIHFFFSSSKTYRRHG
jgi:hypothetical protein